MFLSITTNLNRKIFFLSEVVSLMVEDKTYSNIPNFLLKSGMLSLATNTVTLFSLMWQAHFIFEKMSVKYWSLKKHSQKFLKVVFHEKSI